MNIMRLCIPAFLWFSVVATNNTDFGDVWWITCTFLTAAEEATSFRGINRHCNAIWKYCNQDLIANLDEMRRCSENNDNKTENDIAHFLHLHRKLLSTLHPRYLYEWPSLLWNYANIMTEDEETSTQYYRDRVCVGH